MHEVVAATDETMAEVKILLDAEDAAREGWDEGDDDIEIPSRGFRCNWDSTKKFWCEGRSRVDILIADGMAFGFLGENDILDQARSPRP